MSFSLTGIAHIFACCLSHSSFKLCMYNVLMFMKCIIIGCDAKNITDNEVKYVYEVLTSATRA